MQGVLSVSGVTLGCAEIGESHSAKEGAADEPPVTAESRGPRR